MMHYSENPYVNFKNHYSIALLSEVHSCTVGTKVYNLIRKLNHSGYNRYATAVLASNWNLKNSRQCQNYSFYSLTFLLITLVNAV